MLLHLTEAGSKVSKADDANKDGAKETDPRLSQLQVNTDLWTSLEGGGGWGSFWNLLVRQPS